jgi:hypothetical protein
MSSQVKNVLRGGAAEQAGMAAGDEWLGIDVAAPVATTRQSGAFTSWTMWRCYAGQATRW